MIVQYVSDIHLELRKDSFRPELTPIKQDGMLSVMVLAGDIGNPFHYNYKSLIVDCSEKFDYTFVVAGNHEYYSGKNRKRTMDETDKKLAELCSSYRDVSYLSIDNTVNIIDTKFVGCTLWTKTDERAELLLNDYMNIYVDTDEDVNAVSEYPGSHHDNKRLINSFDVSYRLHMPMLQFLEEEIDNPSDTCNNIIVITHHPPSQRMLRPIQQQLPTEQQYRKYYASDLDDLFRPPVKLWISGHTHHSCTELINGIYCSSNCYGYPEQSSTVTSYQSDRHIIIP